MTGALPPVESSVIPADVRRGGPDAEQAYRAALGLERVFLEQLASGMQSSVEAVGDDAGDGADGGAGQLGGAYASLLPGALADAVTGSGGIGLADSLYRALRAGRGAEPSPGATAGGAPAPGAAS